MTILNALRGRLSARNAPPGASEPGLDSTDDASAPFSGYDRLDPRQVMDSLSDHSQVELERVESYERSHRNRKPVLDKLRYMRGSEPLPGYDALDVAEIAIALETADLTTIHNVRSYERKFANRPDVLEEVVRVHHLHQANHPVSAPPSYQPMSSARS